MAFFRTRFSFSDLPRWRKFVVVCAFGTFYFLVSMSIFEDANIYASAPGFPVAATGQIYQLHVMHGAVRYVTLQQRKAFLFWTDEMDVLSTISFFVAVLVVVTLRKPAVQGSHPGTGIKTSS